MPPPVSELLQPSLSAARPLRRAPYSHQACFFTAFFGGPLAALGITGLNAHRAGRVSMDLRWLLPAAVGWAALLWWWQQAPSGRLAEAWLTDLLGSTGPHFAERAIALLLFGLGAWAQRLEHRAADLMGLARPNGWGPGLLWVGAGNVGTGLLQWGLS